MIAEKLIYHLLEAEPKGDTLVIHKEDPTTDFLKIIYNGFGYPVIDGAVSEEELLEQIEMYPRVFMLGHGCSAGLFASGYVVDHTFGPTLAAKPDGLYIWCHAEVYARKHKLNGLVSGMFISEVGEAAANGIKASQAEVDASNVAFSKAVRAYLDGGLSPHTVKQCYNSATCKITQFNNARLYVMQNGVPLGPDGTPEPEPPAPTYGNDDYDDEDLKFQRPWRTQEEREIEYVTEWIIQVSHLDLRHLELSRNNHRKADQLLHDWESTLDSNRISDEFIDREEHEAIAAIIVKTGLYRQIHNMMHRSISTADYIMIKAADYISSFQRR